MSHAGRLLAVLDFQQGREALAPRAQPVDLRAAEWLKRPIGAHDLPESFVPMTPVQLSWTYVRRTDRDMLPVRYRTQTIHYRHVPGVPLRRLTDSQLLMPRELSAGPGSMAALQQRTGLPQSTVERDLSCLYYAYAITTTAARASPSMASEPEFDSIFRAGVPSHPMDADRTAPALFEHRRTPRPQDPTRRGRAGLRRARAAASRGRPRSHHCSCKRCGRRPGRPA